MTVVQSPANILEEIAEFLSSSPNRKAILSFRPSAAVQARGRELLERQQDHELCSADRRELEQFQTAELLMRLVKSRIHLQESE